ncbi:trehalose-phosphatase [Geobacter grbiciae]|uniref:trehalose-phosphatase n=1 Tax=Geobacter grbiciae TaxID=155042 RepID=UPI001C02C45E|nr:trehalose-phosphatase [Geobacter grbiciae]MBT1074008.1 trehalose-phosphatase [Geobacter grbiciae]
MTYLFSNSGRRELRAFIESTTLFAFDLDGTLAPIVADPAGIVIPSEIRTRLIHLDRMAPVAIITGRSRADALAHLGFVPRFLMGNHGAEGLPGGDESEREFVCFCRGWREQLGILLLADGSAGVVIEDKGATLSLHYRGSPDPERAHREILEAVSRLEPSPRRVSGKFVENLVPRDALHKGEALLRIMEYLGCRRAIFVGDDVTDEDVFRLRDDRIFGIRVGMRAASAARFFIREQGEIGALLDEIMAVLETSAGGNLSSTGP